MHKRLFEIDPWKIRTTTLDRENKRLMESLTSIGNGYMGMRGMFEERYSGDTHQGVYLAGVWFPDKTRVGWWKNGYPDYFGKVINATNFIAVDVFIDGVAVDLAQVAPADFLVELDMQTGNLRREFKFLQGDSWVKLTFERFVSIVTKELSLQKVSVEVLSGSPKIELISKLVGDVHNEDSNYDEMFWDEVGQGRVENAGYLSTRTKPNNFGTPQFSVTCQLENHVNQEVSYERGDAPLLIADKFTWSGSAGQTLVLEKTVAVATSRDVDERAQVAATGALLAAATAKNFDQHLHEQKEAWGKRWAQADVKINGSDEAQQGIRFNLFQLFSTYYGDDARLNVGPKGFTGEKYGGATYWDTESCIVPMYLSVTKPDVTRKLLEYRHDQLDGAKINAGRQGLKGALYPMVTFTGVECHNEWEITFEEIHRNGAIIHAIYNYTTYTGDESYLLGEGMEVLINVARFWADRVHYSARKDQYMIHGVTGPNEYENNVNNNWYTNYLARWVLGYALANFDRANEAVRTALAVSADEKAHWQTIIDKMYLPYDAELDIFVQHDTFLDKDLTPVAQLDPHVRPLNQHWSWDHILRSPYIKQADVLQGIYFFNDQFTMAEKRRNFDFYEPLTVHESSLSPLVHSILAAELGMEDKAVEMYQRTARLDLDNYNNDTEDGLHITSMSGSWLSIVQGFAGMRTTSGLSFKPFCPKDWTSYSFRVGYRERLIEVFVDHDSVTLHLIEGEKIALTLYEQEVELKDTMSMVY